MIVASSILSADQGRLADEIAAVEAAGADWIHIDVMDGHFVPNLTLGPPVIRALRKTSKLPFDVHLMIDRPELSLDQYIDAGADLVTVHAEASVHLDRTLQRIRERGCKAGVALNPATPVVAVQHVLHLTDLVLVMTVNPGFGGQRFIDAALPKIEEVRDLSLVRQLSVEIEVDGGIDVGTVELVTEAGASVLVAGSAIFGSADYRDKITALRAAAVVA